MNKELMEALDILEKEKEIRVYGFSDAKSPLDVLCLPVVE